MRYSRDVMPMKSRDFMYFSVTNRCNKVEMYYMDSSFRVYNVILENNIISVDKNKNLY